jgi:hypothetical protein
MARPDRTALATLVVALAVFCGLCGALPSVWRGNARISDVPVYARYGNAVERGSVPYRDFRPEYPPGAVAAFAVPALVSSDAEGYARAFGLLMSAFGIVAVCACFVTLVALGASRIELITGLAPIAASPLLLGPLVLTRFDLYPAAVTAVALALIVAGWGRTGSVLLGVAVAVKLYPAVLLPLLGAWMWRRRGRREALIAVSLCVGVVLLVFLPFLLLAPDGVVWSIRRQLDRPLQIESAGAAVLLALHHAAGMPLGWASSHGSQNLTGTVAVTAAAITTALQAVALIWLWIRFGRSGTRSAAGLVAACATALVVFVALGKVLSPQFLVWLLPVVPLVAGVRGWVAAALLAASCALTRGWFPDRYWRLVFSFDDIASWLVVVRDVVLLALVVVLADVLRRRAATARST